MAPPRRQQKSTGAWAICGITTSILVILAVNVEAASFAPSSLGYRSCYLSSSLVGGVQRRRRRHCGRRRFGAVSPPTYMYPADEFRPKEFEDNDHSWGVDLDRLDDKPSGQRCILSRRQLAVATVLSGLSAAAPAPSTAETTQINMSAAEVTDPQTYSALAYAPRNKKSSEKLPLIVVLHGAGKNEGTARDLADPLGEHAGLAPSLLSSGRAPSELADNFAVVAPYSAGKRSFYEEPRRKLLQFVDWVCSDAGREAGCPNVDPNRMFLFGFSDGATVGVELLTTGKFRGGVIAAYGFTGELPSLALERLKGVPIWVFHSADDVIFPVKCSDNLVRALRKVNNQDIVRYTRYDRDQEGFTGSVRGHSTGSTASRQADIYKWMLSI